MKSNRGFRHKASDGGSEDLLRRAAKLSPIKKSGKDKRTIYSQMDDDEADAELLRTASGPCRQPELSLAVRSVSRADRPGSGTALRPDG